MSVFTLLHSASKSLVLLKRSTNRHQRDEVIRTDADTGFIHSFCELTPRQPGLTHASRATSTHIQTHTHTHRYTELHTFTHIRTQTHPLGRRMRRSKYTPSGMNYGPVHRTIHRVNTTDSPVTSSLLVECFIVGDMAPFMCWEEAPACLRPHQAMRDSPFALEMEHG